MSRVVEGVYEEGVLQRLRGLDLPEDVRVRLWIEGIYVLL
ncbi:MAG: antitoxin family protein [Desulfurococcales archaeon]|nr:antitoxin family protein [Desulfurococcales archaeon]